MTILHLSALLFVAGYTQGALGNIPEDIATKAKQHYIYYRYGSLNEAVDKNDVKSIKMLIDLGADVNERGPGDKTPLNYAKNAEVTRMLINAGADVNAKSYWNWTPLHAAAQRGDIESVRELIKAGANIYAKTSWGSPAYNFAETDEIKELLKGS